MGYPILKNWSIKRSGAGMTVTGMDESCNLVRLSTTLIRNDAETGHRSIFVAATDTASEATWELA